MVEFRLAYVLGYCFRCCWYAREREECMYTTRACIKPFFHTLRQNCARVHTCTAQQLIPKPKPICQGGGREANNLFEGAPHRSQLSFFPAAVLTLFPFFCLRPPPCCASPLRASCVILFLCCRAANSLAVLIWLCFSLPIPPPLSALHG